MPQAARGGGGNYLRMFKAEKEPCPFILSSSTSQQVGCKQKEALQTRCKSGCVCVNCVSPHRAFINKQRTGVQVQEEKKCFCFQSVPCQSGICIPVVRNLFSLSIRSCKPKVVPSSGTRRQDKRQLLRLSQRGEEQRHFQADPCTLKVLIHFRCCHEICTRLKKFHPAVSSLSVRCASRNATHLLPAREHR